MLSFIKKLFGSRPAETPAPYKVEAPKVEQFPFPSKEPAKAEKKTADKKTVAKAKPARKPKTPKA